MLKLRPGRYRPHNLEKLTPIDKVVIEVIPHGTQRYETCGDWFRTTFKGHTTLRVFASKLNPKDDPYNFMAMCVAYHELGEALACIANNITEHEVDNWDLNYPGDDPGDDDDCPYVAQHRIATNIERTLVTAMGLFWSQYEKAIGRLFKNGKKM